MASVALWGAFAACALEVSLGPRPDGGAGGSDVGGHTSVGGFDGGFLCQPGPDDDVDQDGFSENEGDCDDCNPMVNPNAVEVVLDTASADEDCDGEVDEELVTCDGALALDDADPVHAAMAIDLCKMSSGPDDWGLVEAKWTMPDGSDVPTPMMEAYHVGHGIVSSFGVIIEPQRGERMLALSSGVARRPGDPGYVSFAGHDKGYTSPAPEGFPKESPSCPDVVTGEPHDAVAVELQIQTPSNALGISFDFDFYTYEWPTYICSQYNDFFVALLDPRPPGQVDASISFDSQGNPVSVNNAFLEVCGCPGNPPSPCAAGGKVFSCALGNTELVNTGFGFDTELVDHAATSWLSTEAPVPPRQVITVRLAIYDSFDGAFDSLALIDNLRWVAEPASVKTERVPK